LRRTLNAHSRIYCGPETKFFRDFYGDYPEDPLRHGRFFTSARAVLPQDVLLELFGQAFVVFHERAALEAGKDRWADKCPENVLYLHEWGRLLGEAWALLHVVRNPLDTLASQKEIAFPLILPKDIESRIDLYTRYTQAGIDFGASHPDQYYLLIYEQLVTSPAQTLTNLMTWLHERYESGQLEFNSPPTQAGLEDPKIDLTRHVHRDSVGRWSTILAEPEVNLIRSQLGGLWASVDPGDNASVAHWY
jgi:hypothetical protein